MSEGKKIRPFKMLLEANQEGFVLIHWDRITGVVEVGGGRISIEFFLGNGDNPKVGKVVVEGSVRGFFERFGEEYPVDFNKIC